MDLLKENADVLQQIATLVWVNSGDTTMIKSVLTARVGLELWGRVSGQAEIDALRNKTIMDICKYVKDHPNAPKDDLTKYIGKKITEFAAVVGKV